MESTVLPPLPLLFLLLLFIAQPSGSSYVQGDGLTFNRQIPGQISAPSIACLAPCQDASNGRFARHGEGEGGETDLDEYLGLPDKSFEWRDTGQHIRGLLPFGWWMAHVLNVTSQQWLSESETSCSLWTHQLVLIRPSWYKYTSTVMLLLGGGVNSGEPVSSWDEELQLMAAVATRTRSMTALLKQVPNQPCLFANDPVGMLRHEDDLVAFTWRHFLDHPANSSNWLLRFPMVKAAVRAMDTIQSYILRSYGHQVDNFIVGGASKRGWATWLAGATDTRVVGIAPMVIDLLNASATMHHIYRSLGGWPYVFGPYYDLNITRDIDDPHFKLLMSKVDPIHFLPRLTMPKLVVSTSNDEFFPIDNTAFSFAALPPEKHLLILANADHTLLLGIPKLFGSLCAFMGSLIDSLGPAMASLPRPVDGLRAGADSSQGGGDRTDWIAGANADRDRIDWIVGSHAGGHRIEQRAGKEQGDGRLSEWSPAQLVDAGDGSRRHDVGQGRRPQLLEGGNSPEAGVGMQGTGGDMQETGLAVESQDKSTAASPKQRASRQAQPRGISPERSGRPESSKGPWGILEELDLMTLGVTNRLRSYMSDFWALMKRHFQQEQSCRCPVCGWGDEWHGHGGAGEGERDVGGANGCNDGPLSPFIQGEECPWDVELDQSKSRDQKWREALEAVDGGESVGWEAGEEVGAVDGIGEPSHGMRERSNGEARSAGLGTRALPKYHFHVNRTAGTIEAVAAERPLKVLLWSAHNDRRDFRRTVADVGGSCRLPVGGGCLQPIVFCPLVLRPYFDDGDFFKYRGRVPKPERGYTAFFLELHFQSLQLDLRPPYIFTTEAVITPDTYPVPDCTGQECRGKLV